MSLHLHTGWEGRQELFVFLPWGLAAHAREESRICSISAGRCIFGCPQLWWIQVLVEPVCACGQGEVSSPFSLPGRCSFGSA